MITNGMFLHRLPVLISITACLLLALLAPGWRGLLSALDYQSLANCALPNVLNLTARIGDGPSRHTLYVAHDLTPGCDVTTGEPFTAEVTFLNGGDNWLSVTPSSGTLLPAARNAVRVVFTPALLPEPGTYQGFVHIRVPRLNGTITIPVNAALTAAVPELGLSASTVVFQAVTQTGPPAGQVVQLSNSGVGRMDWSIDTARIPSWLNVTPTSGAVTAGGAPAAITLVPNTAALAANAYTALLPVRSGVAKNTPQYIAVTYHVVQPTAGATPLLSDYNLTFSVRVGTTVVQQKTVLLSNTGGSTLNASFTVRTTTGSWLSITPGSASVLSGSPVQLRISANPGGLTAGVYTGSITGTFSNRVPQVVEVVLVVTPGISGNSLIAPAASGRAALEGCTPTTMVVLGSTVGTGINSPVSFPQSLVAQVLDNCGEPVANATVIATAAGVNIPMSNSGSGFYSGTWSPTATGTGVSITFTAFHPSFTSQQTTYGVTALTASGGTVLPVVFHDGVVEGAGFTPRRPLVPGGIISLFGSNLAAATQAASVIPLERQLGQTSVRIGGIDAPLYFVSPGQINAQVPFESRPGETAAVVVSVGGRLTAPQNYLITAAQPGIFTDSLGPAILDDQFRRVTSSNPARVGRVIQMFVGGLGDTNPPVASGGAINTGTNTNVPVSVEIGGVDAPVQYSGFAPGFVGLYQVNVTIPNVSPGSSVPIILRQNGAPANPGQTIVIAVAP